MNIETAKRLFEYRKANGFSQEELAEKIGVSRQAISKWERSESSPDTDNLIALANLYGITIDELLNGTDAPKKITEEEQKEQPEDKQPETENRYYTNNEKEEKTDINFNNGFNVENGKDKVHIGWDGIHVESKEGDNVHVSGNGVHVETKDGHIYNKPTPPFYSPKPEKNPWLHALLPIAVVFLYLFFGFFTRHGWAIGWIMFLFIPIIETAITAIKTKNPARFCYPVFVTAMYLSGGMILHIWHPTWILFITIPMYYIICDAYNKTHRKKYDDFTQYNSANGTYYSPNGTYPSTQTKSRSGSVAAVIISIICGITIISVVAISCVFGFLGNSVGDIIEDLPFYVSTGSYSYDNESLYTVGSGEIPANGITELSIDWISHDITVEYYDGNTISFSEPNQSNPDYALRYRVDGNELKIKFCKSGFKASNPKDKELTVRLPKGLILNELEIDCISANTNIKGITAYSFDVDTVSGNINAEGNFKEIDIDGVSANSKIITHNAIVRLNSDSVSGDCSVFIPADIDGFTINCETVSGEVYTNDFKVSSVKKAHGNGTYVYGNGNAEIKIDSVSGDFDINAIK
ncbi:MAG: helix-turn-helix domain-containing protein [Eubacterium sp.]|nr:helix-turn-helix domain-containing protein [Eubacterium sp.]